MKYKKVLTGVLSATILTVTALTALAVSPEDLRTAKDVNQIKDILPISAETSIVKQNYFNSFTGKVLEISGYDSMKGSKMVLTENENGERANIIVSENTYVANNAVITVGATITGYFEANMPMIMIYPAQYVAEVVVVKSEEINVKVAVFDKDLLSDDNDLKLNISDKTEIISQDGKPYEGELANRKLVVSYSFSTKSIPAQTTPTKIVVLFEKADSLMGQPTEEVTATAIGDVSNMDMIVNNTKIDAPKAYTNEQGTVMVPLRAIAEALGFEVSWNNELSSIMIGKDISLTINKDHYIYSKTDPIHLGTAPALVEGRTFVPLSFFRKVMGMNNAYVFEAQIVVDDGELMN